MKVNIIREQPKPGRLKIESINIILNEDETLRLMDVLSCAEKAYTPGSRTENFRIALYRTLKEELN